MAKNWRKTEWNDEMRRIVDAAVDDYMSKIDTESYSRNKIEAIRREKRKEGFAEMEKDFGYSLSDKDKSTVSGWAAEDASRYLFSRNKLYRNSFNPILKKRMDDFARLGPLAHGIADEGRDWYSMDAVDLFKKGADLGYDTSTKEGKMDFLRDVSDVQMAHDRGKLLEEFNEKSPMWQELFLPTMMEEVRKQIATGSGTQEQLDEARMLDLVVNAGIGFAPVLGDIKSIKASQALRKIPGYNKAREFLGTPMVSGALPAVGQGALEAERQLVKETTDPDLEADYTNALLALTLGLTRPGMLGTLNGIVSRIPGNTPARIAAGISASTRTGNPVLAEREGLEHGFDIYNRLFKNRPKQTSPVPVENPRSEIMRNGREVTLADVNDARLVERLKDKVKALYTVDDTDGSFVKDFDVLFEQTPKDKFLSDYDNISKMTVYSNPSAGYTPFVYRTTGTPNGYMVADNKLRPGNYLTNLEQAFPAKMAEAYGRDKAYKFGLRAGELLGALGGSIEPAIKLNPFGPLSGGNIRITNTDYQETPWYKNLSKKQQEAFDDAYEKSKKKASE